MKGKAISRPMFQWNRNGILVELVLGSISVASICLFLSQQGELFLVSALVFGAGPIAWLATVMLVNVFKPPAPETEAPSYLLTGPVTGVIERTFFALAIGFELGGATTAMVAWLTLKNSNLWQTVSQPANIGDRWVARIDLVAGFVSMIGATLAGIVLKDYLP